VDLDIQGNVTATGRSRALSLIFFFIVIFSLLVLRLIFLQLIMHEFYIEKAKDQRQRTITLAPDRGDIFDRSGNILATSINSFSLVATPADIKDKYSTASIIANTLKINRGEVYNKLISKKPFVWIKRKLEKPIAQKIMDKKLEGLSVREETKRVYPKRKLASQIVGFVGVDNEGLAGLELSFDRYLKGQAGELLMEKDVSGRDIITSNIRSLKDKSDGMNITLTIDEPTQYVAETAIKKAVKENNAKGGSVIVMDIKNGEILAIATYPDFDPNEYQKSDPATWGSRIVTDVYEPGSTFKLITVASGIDEGVITKNSLIYSPDTLIIGGRTIKNSHKLDFKTHNLTVSQILEQSVNTGAAQISIKMGKDRFSRRLKEFGFGEFTGIGLPGESRGILYEPSKWNKPDIAMMAFGQTIAVTPVQLIVSMASLVNGGVKLKPILVKKIESPDLNFIKVYANEGGSRVISEKTSKDMLDLTEDVVENGTGKPAKIDGFRVGGKTGTAQKSAPGGGYLEGHYRSSFVGVLPLSDPRIITLVIVDDPYPVYWGERVAAPVFRDVSEFVVRRLNIVPDKQNKAVI
jgi:stage V sporulation protein D (sporulation-specific penicillin-binding protein)